jgi:hypothetical protein
MDGAQPTLPEGLCVDLDNANRPMRDPLRYRATVPSWCAAHGERYEEKRGFLSIAAAFAWREMRIRAAKAEGKTSGRRNPAAPPEPSAEEIAVRLAAECSARKERKAHVPAARVRLEAARAAAATAKLAIEAHAALHDAKARLSDDARTERAAELDAVASQEPLRASWMRPYECWSPSLSTQEMGMRALLEDRLFSNLAEQLPQCSVRSIVHAMHRCYNHAPLAFVLLTCTAVMRDVCEQWQRSPNSLGDADVLERHFERAAQRVMRPCLSQRQCDQPCELPCAWVVPPHPDHSERACYPWQLAPHELSGVTSDFSRKRRRAGKTCAFEWECRCEACCHVWLEEANTTKFGVHPPCLWGPRPPKPWSSFFVHGRPEPIRDCEDADYGLHSTHA